jgi:predicted metal-dependent phosphoesterase TrpH
VGLADLHLHTLASDGLIGPEALVDHVVAHTDLDIIAVTDHDETAAALAARSHATHAGYRLEVIPGVEVTTRDGHLLCLWIEERPAALWPMMRTAEWVCAQGGLCVAPHPFTRWTHSLNLRALTAAVREGLVAGVEVMNASLAGRASRPRALAFAEAHRLGQVGASDAHMVSMIGLARTRFAGRTAGELRGALEAAATQAEGRFATPAEMAAEAIPQLARSMVHLPLRRIVRYARATVQR